MDSIHIIHIICSLGVWLYYMVSLKNVCSAIQKEKCCSINAEFPFSVLSRVQLRELKPSSSEETFKAGIGVKGAVPWMSNLLICRVLGIFSISMGIITAFPGRCSERMRNKAENFSLCSPAPMFPWKRHPIWQPMLPEYKRRWSPCFPCR